jgi:hypothetical protein
MRQNIPIHFVMRWADNDDMKSFLALVFGCAALVGCGTPPALPYYHTTSSAVTITTNAYCEQYVTVGSKQFYVAIQYGKAAGTDFFQSCEVQEIGLKPGYARDVSASPSCQVTYTGSAGSKTWTFSVGTNAATVIASTGETVTLPCH